MIHVPQNALSFMGKCALKYVTTYDMAVLPLEVAKIDADGRVRCSCKEGLRCDQGIGKHPVGRLAPHGFQNATRDVNEVRRMWTEVPDASIGLRTGSKKSGGSGLVVVDLDDKPGKEGSLEFDLLKDHLGGLPDTWKAKTGSGWHVFYKYNEDSPLRVGNRQGILLPGMAKKDKLRSIDIRGENGYVVGAPSPHYSGRTYNWVDGAPLDFPIADIPQSLLELLGRDPEAKPDAAIMPEGDWGPIKKRLKLARVYLQKMDASVSGQGGHNALFRAAFFLLRGFVLPTDVVYDVLMEDFNPRCLPPWKHTDIVHKIEQAVVNCDQPWGFCLENIERSKLEKEAEKLKSLMDQTKPKPKPQTARQDDVMATDGATALDVGEGTGAAPPAQSFGGGLPQPKRQRVFLRGDHAELCDALREVFDEDESPLMWDEGGYYKYSREMGIWQPVEIEDIKKCVRDFAGNAIIGTRKTLHIRAADAAGAEMFLRCDMVSERRWRFAHRWSGIAYRNGFAQLDGDKIVLHQHCPEQMSKHVFDFDYHHGLAHPELDAFFETVFGDVPDPKDRADRIALLQEYIGTCLVGHATKYQRCLILTGSGKGGNGKSQVLDIARSIFPPSTVSALPPQNWGEQFHLVGLVGKLANFIDELPKDGVANTNRFKGVVSGEAQFCDIKNKTPFEFRPVAGNIFNCNVLFQSDDQSDGFWRRQLVVPMTRNMRDLPGGEQPEIGRQIGERERAAISAWALEGACRVARQKGYTVPKSSERAIEKWRTDNDAVRKFLLDPINRPKLDHVIGWQASAMYDAFKVWAQGRNFAQLNETTFGRRIGTSGVVDKCRKSSGNYYRLNEKGLAILKGEEEEALVEEKEDNERMAREAMRRAEANPPAPPTATATEATPPAETSEAPIPPTMTDETEPNPEVQEELPLSYEAGNEDVTPEQWTAVDELIEEVAEDDRWRKDVYQDVLTHIDQDLSNTDGTGYPDPDEDPSDTLPRLRSREIHRRSPSVESVEEAPSFMDGMVYSRLDPRRGLATIWRRTRCSLLQVSPEVTMTKRCGLGENHALHRLLSSATSDIHQQHPRHEARAILTILAGDKPPAEGQRCLESLAQGHLRLLVHLGGVKARPSLRRAR